MVGNSRFWVDIEEGLAKVMATGLSTGVLCSGKVSSNKSVLQVFVKEGRIRKISLVMASCCKRVKLS